MVHRMYAPELLSARLSEMRRYYFPPGVTTSNGKNRVDYFDSSKQVIHRCMSDSDPTIRELAVQLQMPHVQIPAQKAHLQISSKHKKPTEGQQKKHAASKTTNEPIAGKGLTFRVSGAGVAPVNGIYSEAKQGTKDEVSYYTNKGTSIILFRYSMPRTRERYWYLAESTMLQTARGDYYRVKSESALPPCHLDWTVEQCPDGVLPVPQVVLNAHPEQTNSHAAVALKPPGQQSRCESCQQMHDGTYGKGRFCSKRCRSSHNCGNRNGRVSRHEGSATTWKHPWPDPAELRREYVARQEQHYAQATGVEQLALGNSSSCEKKRQGGDGPEWIRCGKCHKWRREGSQLGNQQGEWLCDQNVDVRYNRCSVEQEQIWEMDIAIELSEWLADRSVVDFPSNVDHSAAVPSELDAGPMQLDAGPMDCDDAPARSPKPDECIYSDEDFYDAPASPVSEDDLGAVEGAALAEDNLTHCRDAAPTAGMSSVVDSPVGVGQQCHQLLERNGGEFGCILAAYHEGPHEGKPSKDKTKRRRISPSSNCGGATAEKIAAARNEPVTEQAAAARNEPVTEQAAAARNEPVTEQAAAEREGASNELVVTLLVSLRSVSQMQA